MHRSPAALTSALAIVAIVPGGASATDYIVTVGGRGAVNPPYEGAPNEVVRPSVVFSIRRADAPWRFTPPDDGGAFALFAGRHFDLGPVLKFRYSRGNTGRLTGFDKIGFAVEPGVFADYWFTDWLRVKAQVRQGVAGHRGTVGNAGIDVIHTGKRWDFSIGPRFGYGDARYMDTYFGVTPAEAAASPLIRTAYRPGAGGRYGGIEAAYAYQISHHLRAVADLGYHRLVNRAAKSPVVDVAGSRNQFSGGVSLTYSFGIHLGHRD